MSRRFWSDVEVRILTDHYPDSVTADIAKALGRTIEQVHSKAASLGIKKSQAFLNGPHAYRLRGDTGEKTRFKKGDTPWNKGVPGSTGTHPNSKRTQFKKGELMGAARHNYVPIGTTRITRDGILERKVTDDPSLYPARRWVPVSRLVWEAQHGAIPAKHIVRFKTGMATTIEEEITVDRLECISLSENMRRNTLHNYPKEIALAIQMRGALNRKINHVTRHQRSA